MPIIILVVIILAFILYTTFFKGSSNDSDVLSNDGANPDSQSEPVGQAFINQLLTLQNIQLNDSVFSDPRFQSLQDFSQPIPDEPQGRPNPFAPIGVDVINNARVSSGGDSGTDFTFESATSSSNQGSTPRPPTSTSSRGRTTTP